MQKDMIVIHCTDTPHTVDIGAEEIGQWHRQRGWSGIGYNYVIRRDGTLELGRDLDGDWNAVEETGAHALGYNRRSIGIALVGGRGNGGRPEPNFTDAQLSTLRAIVGTLRAFLPAVRVVGHRDLPGVKKTCPTFDVATWMETGRLEP